MAVNEKCFAASFLRKIIPWKFFILIAIFLTGTNTSQAQSEFKHALYLGSNLGVGNYFGVDFNLNYAYQEKYALKLGLTGHIRKAKSQPYDYSAGFFNALLLGLGHPVDQLSSIQLAAGRIYRLNKKGTIRANLSLGLGYTTIREPGNWRRNDNSFLMENYSWDYEKYHTLSLIINPKIEFPISIAYGFSVSPMIQLNKDRIYMGIGIGNIIGMLRKRNLPVTTVD